MKNQIDTARNIPLKTVLLYTGAKNDKYDKSKWHTSKGVVSITNQKFFNWTQNKGGGGAIDLVMHLNDFTFKQALCWINTNFCLDNALFPKPSKKIQKNTFVLPERDDSKLLKIVDYLRYQRRIPLKIINQLICSGKLYADKRQNAVFLLLGKKNKAIGAELVGTTHVRWRGMAPGSKKNNGYFQIQNNTPKSIILCESAIDAVSFYALQTHCMAISTSGAVTNLPWISDIICHGINVFCGFDADEAGDRMANNIIRKYPYVKRLKPSKKDWNDVLRGVIKNIH